MRILWPLALACWACSPEDPGGPDPCSGDPLACAESGVFEIDAACVSDEPLVVRLAEGRDAARLAPLAAGQAPTVHFGVQGGQHLELGFIADNPDPAHERFRATFTVAPQAADAEQWLVTTREVVAGTNVLSRTPEGGLSLAGVVVFVEFDTVAGEARIELVVEDTCGRTATVEHPFDGTGGP